MEEVDDQTLAVRIETFASAIAAQQKRIYAVKEFFRNDNPYPESNKTYTERAAQVIGRVVDNQEASFLLKLISDRAEGNLADLLKRAREITKP